MIPILAPPRSCSSLISAMLGQHPSLYAPAELECFTANTLAGCFAFSQRVPIVTMHGLLRTVAQLQSGHQNEASVAKAHHWLEERFHWSGQDLVSWIETQVAPRRLIEKSPIHVLRWPSMVQLAAVCEGQPVIHLCRHPVTAIRSLIAAYRLTPTQAITTWAQGHRHCLRYGQEMTTEPTLLLRSEDLLAEPEAWLERVCKHLGIDAGPAAINAMLHPEFSPYACVGPSSASSGNDPHWMAAPMLRRGGSVEDPPALQQLWNLDDLPVDLVMLTVELGWALGYQ